MAQAQAQVREELAQSRPIVAETNDPVMRRILDNIEELGLSGNLLDLLVQGFCVVPGVLSEDRIERAKAAMVRRAETVAGCKIDPDTLSGKDFNGAKYLHYMMFDDPVFPEILLEPKPLALITYLLGENCLLSSMGCHFRGPGGMPLPIHVDGMPDECLGPTALIGNCNYALTPYSQEEGALVLFPGSHKKNRGPTAPENWTAGGKTIMEIMEAKPTPAEIDKIDWKMPAGGVTIEINPGDAVVWHGNSWHAGWRREVPGARINLAAYFCRDGVTTQELRKDPSHAEVFERYKDEPRFAQLMGENVFNGWRDEGPKIPGLA